MNYKNSRIEQMNYQKQKANDLYSLRNKINEFDNYRKLTRKKATN